VRWLRIQSVSPSHWEQVRSEGRRRKIITNARMTLAPKATKKKRIQ